MDVWRALAVNLISEKTYSPSVNTSHHKRKPKPLNQRVVQLLRRRNHKEQKEKLQLQVGVEAGAGKHFMQADALQWKKVLDRQPHYSPESWQNGQVTVGNSSPILQRIIGLSVFDLPLT